MGYMEKLSVKSLQIGDWVIPHIWDTIGKPSRIVGINYNSWEGSDYCDWVDCETWDELSLGDIEPVPLTAEILEKNGWEECNTDLDDNDKQYGYTYGKYEITWWRDVKLLGCLFRDKQVGLCYEMIVEMPIKYVHQLQHALRLCGIEKEIIL